VGREFSVAAQPLRASITTVPLLELPRPKTKRLWTYDELVAEFPESNQPRELWDGELIVPPAPGPEHQTMVKRMTRLLDALATQHNLGEVVQGPLDVLLSPRRTIQPDGCFVSSANARIIQDHIGGVPDLVVEVIAEGSWRRDRVDKKTLYEQCAVREYWIVDPEAGSIEVFALVAGAYRRHSNGVGGEAAASKSRSTSFSSEGLLAGRGSLRGKADSERVEGVRATCPHCGRSEWPEGQRAGRQPPFGRVFHQPRVGLICPLARSACFRFHLAHQNNEHRGSSAIVSHADRLDQPRSSLRSAALVISTSRSLSTGWRWRLSTGW
jgi:Uma2 family endonuclease